MIKNQILLLLSSLFLWQGVAFAQSDYAGAVQDYKSAVQAIGQPLFTQSIIQYQHQAAEIAKNNAIYSTDTSNQGFKNQVNDPQVTENSKQFAPHFADTVNSVGQEQIKQVQLKMPQLDHIQTLGQDVIVSEDGLEVLSMIRKLQRNNPAETQSTLMALKGKAAKGNPEALNFVGWVLEYGLFGAKQDMRRAVTYYEDAANKGYQTAIYNLATVYFFGKNGIPKNDALAKRYADQAASNTRESSGRLCGLASFINYRLRHGQEALRFAQDCNSALVNISKVTFSNTGTQEERVRLLETSIATGANDGFNELEKLGRADNQDQSLLFCKYHLLNQYRLNEDRSKLREDAKECYLESHTVTDFNTKRELGEREGRISGIVGFVSLTSTNLANMRRSNVFRYSLSVPYLPFDQLDVDRFHSILTKLAPHP